MARTKVDNKLNVVVGTKAQVEGDTSIPENSIVVVTDAELKADEIVYSVEKNVKEAIEDLETQLLSKQDKLVSGTTIKTVNGQSLLGEGDMEISFGPGKTILYGVTTGTGSAYALSLSGVTELQTGMVISVKFHINNNVNATLNINGLGAVGIRRSGASFTSSSFSPGSVVILTYDGSFWNYTDQNNTYPAMTQTDLDTNSSNTTGRVVSPKLLRDNLYLKSEVDAKIQSDFEALSQDLVTDAELTDALSTKADSADLDSRFALKADKTETYTKTQTDAAIDAAISAIDIPEVDLSPYATKTEVTTGLSGKANVGDLNAKADKSTVYTKTETENYVDAAIGAIVIPDPDLSGFATKTELNTKADKSTTYTKTQTESLISDAVNSIEIPEVNISHLATKVELETKADKSETYTKDEVDDEIAEAIDAIEFPETDLSHLATKTELTSGLSGKADTSSVTTVAGRVTTLETNSATKTELSSGLSGKADSTRVTTVEGKVTALESTVDSLETDKANKTDLNAKADKTALTTAEGRITTLETKATNLETNKANKTDVTTSLNLKADKTTVSGIDGRLQTVEGEIDTLQSDLSDLEQTHDSRLDNLETNKANTADIYTRGEVDVKIADIISGGEIDWDGFATSDHEHTLASGKIADVLTTGATNGQVLKFDSASGKWKPAADNNSTYSVLSQAEVTAGTATASRLVTPKLLRDNFYLIGTVDSLLAEKAALVHGHAISEVTGLQVALDSKLESFTEQDPTVPSHVKSITAANITSWNTASTHAGTAHAPSNAQANIIEVIKVNGVARTITSKAVDITVPTTASEVGALPFTHDAKDVTATKISAWDSASTHAGTAHAPANAQKNSDITKAEIEAKLTGDITSHSHTVSYNDLTNKPTIPSLPGNITKADITGGSSVVGKLAEAKSIKEAILELSPAGSRPASDVSAWAKASTKPAYTASEVGALASIHPAKDVTAAKISEWNAKSDFSGSYNDLTNKPTIPSIPSVMTTAEGNTGTATTQRTISAANLKSIILNHSPAGSRPASDVSAWAKASTKPTYSASEVGALASTHAAKDVTAAKISAWDAKSDFSGNYNDLTNKPTIPTIPSVMTVTEGSTGTATTQRTIDAAALKSIILSHSPAGSRPASDVSAWAKAGTKPTYGKSEVGLGNVDNTSDANKPISTATQTALDAKENSIAAGTTTQYLRGDKTWQTLNKAAVGLGNVSNTSDANKPISTATQNALNLKADAAHTHALGDITGGTALKDRVTDLESGLENANTNVSTNYVPRNWSGLTNSDAVLTDKILIQRNNDVRTTSIQQMLADLIDREIFLIVTALPTTDIKTNKIYLVSSGGTAQHRYDEYIYANGGWEYLGRVQVDLSGYVKTTTKVNNKALSGDITLTASDVGAMASNHAASGVTSALITSWNTASTHAGTAHAPSNAQKNSDITKAEIEAKLTGVIASHTHNASDIVEDASHRFVTDTEKTKLSGIQAGAQVNAVTSVAGKTGAVVLAKADVGLGSVQNYAIASKTQAESGTSNVLYMTPLRTKELITVVIGDIENALDAILGG